MQKRRGKAWYIFYHVNDVSVYLGRQRGEGSPIETTHSTQVFFHFEPEAVRMFLLHERLKLQPLGAETARYMYM